MDIGTFSAPGLLLRRIPASLMGLGIGGKPVKPDKPVKPASPPTPGSKLKLISFRSLLRNGFETRPWPPQLPDRAEARVVAVALLCCCWASCKLCQMAAECS